jgi:hypothetical protein
VEIKGEENLSNLKNMWQKEEGFVDRVRGWWASY